MFATTNTLNIRPQRTRVWAKIPGVPNLAAVYPAVLRWWATTFRPTSRPIPTIGIVQEDSTPTRLCVEEPFFLGNPTIAHHVLVVRYADNEITVLGITQTAQSTEVHIGTGNAYVHKPIDSSNLAHELPTELQMRQIDSQHPPTSPIGFGTRTLRPLAAALAAATTTTTITNATCPAESTTWSMVTHLLADAPLPSLAFVPGSALTTVTKFIRPLVANSIAFPHFTETARLTAEIISSALADHLCTNSVTLIGWVAAAATAAAAAAAPYLDGIGSVSDVYYPMCIARRTNTIYVRLSDTMCVTDSAQADVELIRILYEVAAASCHRNGDLFSEPIFTIRRPAAAVLRASLPCAVCQVPAAQCRTARPLIWKGLAFLTASDVRVMLPAATRHAFSSALFVATAALPSVWAIGARSECTCGIVTNFSSSNVPMCPRCSITIPESHELITAALSDFRSALGQDTSWSVFGRYGHVTRESMRSALLLMRRLQPPHQQQQSPTTQPAAAAAAAATAMTLTFRSLRLDDKDGPHALQSNLPGYEELEAADWNVVALRPAVPPCLANMIDRYAIGLDGYRGHPKYPERMHLLSWLIHIKGLATDSRGALVTTWRHLFLHHENEKTRRLCLDPARFPATEYGAQIIQEALDHSAAYNWGCRSAVDKGFCPFSSNRRRDVIWPTDIEDMYGAMAAAAAIAPKLSQIAAETAGEGVPACQRTCGELLNRLTGYPSYPTSSPTNFYMKAWNRMGNRKKV